MVDVASPFPRSARVLAAGVLAIAYFIAAAATVRFTRFEGGVAFIWVAGGLLLGALVVAERRRWLELIAACAIPSVAVTCLFGLGAAAAVPLALTNIGEALLGAWLLKRFCPACGDLKSVGDIGFFVMVAGLVAPASGAFFGAAIAAKSAGVAYWPNWLAWYTGHALGTVAIAPLTILLLRGDLLDWMNSSPRARLLEAAMLLGQVAVVTAAVFAQTRYPLLFLPLLPMMVAVFRLGRFGAIMSLLVIGLIGSVLTIHGMGPVSLVHGGNGLRAQLLQLYLASAMIMAFLAAGDLKQRRHTVEMLEEQAALHRLILDRTGDVIMTLALDGRIRFVSASAERVLGLMPDELVGTMPHDIIHADDIARVVEVHRRLLTQPDQTLTVEYRVVIASRELGWFETHARATLDDEERASGAVIIIRDVTQRKIDELQLTTAAFTDPLTGLANRRAFDQALAARLDAGKASGPAVLAMFDLDHFKAVNDTKGHAAGDQVLRVFADILRAGTREHDLVARIGGEEFAAFIVGDLDAARTVCERVRMRLAELEIALDGGDRVRVTVSAGIAAIPPTGSPEALLASADTALYEAKAAGRNQLMTTK